MLLSRELRAESEFEHPKAAKTPKEIEMEQDLHAMQIRNVVKESVGQLPNIVATQKAERRRNAFFF